MPRPLKMFMRGKKVTMLQNILSNMGYPMNDQPGLFGTSTRDAVKAFQKQRAMKVTGQVDDDLMQRMQQGDSMKTTETVVKKIPAPVDQQQLDALTRLLIRKGLIEEKELQAEMKRPQPIKITQPPLT